MRLMKAFRPAGLLLAMLVMATSCASMTASKNSGRAASGQRNLAPDFTLTDSMGHEVKLSDYLGKSLILLDFWATWCRPCEALLPHVQAIHEQYKSKGLVVLGIALDDTQTLNMVAPFAHKHGLSFPILVDDGQAVQLYNPDRQAPFQVLIDQHGRIVKTREGYSPGDELLLGADIRRLLNE